jgi:cyclopropane-fatty-acyl-phospholipid synthase
MHIDGRRSIGPDYAETLHRWRETFLARTPEVRALGFDETFVRMWDFYLAYSEAGFATRYLDDWQFGIAR